MKYVVLPIFLLLFPAPLFASDESPVLTVAFGGDIMLGRHVVRDGQRHHLPHQIPFPRLLKNALAGGDLAIANLEMAFCEEAAPEDFFRADALALTAPVSQAGRIRTMGVDVVSIANNHAMDCGPESLQMTTAVMEQSGLKVVGQSLAPLVLQRGTIEIVVLATTVHPPPLKSFFGYTLPSIWWGWRQRPHRLLEEIRKVRTQYPTALLILSVHWGREGQSRPEPQQILTADLILRAGVDILHGHGAHQIQPHDVRDDGLILYNVGDLYFDRPGKKSVFVVHVRRQKDAWDFEVVVESVFE